MNIRPMVLTIFILAGLPAAVAHTDNLPQFGTHTRDQFQDYWYNHGSGNFPFFFATDALRRNPPRGCRPGVCDRKNESRHPDQSGSSRGARHRYPKIKCRQKIFYRHLSLFHYDLDFCAGGCPKLSAAAENQLFDPGMVRSCIHPNEFE